MKCIALLGEQAQDHIAAELLVELAVGIEFGRAIQVMRVQLWYRIALTAFRNHVFGRLNEVLFHAYEYFGGEYI